MEKVEEILGTPRNRDKYETNDVAGVVTGLAWTSVGGDILFIESILSKGKGNLSITGNLGTVMKESATIALQYIKSNAEEFDGADSWYPFLIEDKFKQSGSAYSAAAPKTPYIVWDFPLLTGQNPESTTLLTNKLIALLSH